MMKNSSQKAPQNLWKNQILEPQEFVKLYIIAMTTYYAILRYENGTQTQTNRINVLLLWLQTYGVTIPK